MSVKNVTLRGNTYQQPVYELWIKFPKTKKARVSPG
jgi:hypothetical protein